MTPVSPIHSTPESPHTSQAEQASLTTTAREGVVSAAELVGAVIRVRIQCSLHRRRYALAMRGTGAASQGTTACSPTYVSVLASVSSFVMAADAAPVRLRKIPASVANVKIAGVIAAIPHRPDKLVSINARPRVTLRASRVHHVVIRPAPLDHRKAATSRTNRRSTSLHLY